MTYGRAVIEKAWAVLSGLASALVIFLVARVEVFDPDGRALLGSRDLHGSDFRGGGFQRFVIAFTLKETRRLEFPIWFTGEAGLWVDRIVLRSEHTSLRKLYEVFHGEECPLHEDDDE